MHDADLFQRALGLEEPWEVAEVSFDVEQRRLGLRIDLPRGTVFCCPECGAEGLKARDTEVKTWRHLDFFLAPGVPDRAGAAGGLPGGWGASGQGSVGA